MTQTLEGAQDHRYKPNRILLVDNSALALQQFSDFAREGNYKVTAVNTAEEFLREVDRGFFTSDDTTNLDGILRAPPPFAAYCIDLGLETKDFEFLERRFPAEWHKATRNWQRGFEGLALCRYLYETQKRILAYAKERICALRGWNELKESTDTQRMITLEGEIKKLEAFEPAWNVLTPVFIYSAHSSQITAAKIEYGVKACIEKPASPEAWQDIGAEIDEPVQERLIRIYEERKMVDELIEEKRQRLQGIREKNKAISGAL